MRVIRTEFYFDQSQVRATVGQKVPEFPGVSIAWFKNPRVEEGMWPGLPAGLPDFPLPRMSEMVGGQYRAFLDAALYEGESAFGPGYGVIPADERNPELVDYLLQQGVIVEQSPPQSIPLASLLAHGTNLSLGSALGYVAAGGSIPLMFVTVPAGVIVMGAAVGISNGLKNGLQKKIEQLFGGHGPDDPPRHEQAQARRQQGKSRG